MVRLVRPARSAQSDVDDARREGGTAIFGRLSDLAPASIPALVHHPKTWRESARDALVPGTTAAVTSTAALMASGEAWTGSPFAPTNAVSHWLWGDEAARRNRLSWRYTGTGYATHHLAAVLWATLYEKLFGRRHGRDAALASLAEAATIAAVAYVVDYHFTPRRLMPGYERRVPRRSLLAMYVALGAGFALGGALLGLRERRT
jgi:hypothetical protein